MLPKTAPTSAITVFDLSQELTARSHASYEAYEACLAIQGIVNRSSSNKIFFTHSPIEWSWNLSRSNIRNLPFDQYWIDDGLIPVPVSQPSLNNSNTYPVLTYLLQTYGAYLKGMVMTPDANSAKNYDGARAAAYTACGILDAIPVSSAISAYLSGQGFSLAQLADTRQLTNNLMAFGWAWTNYFKPETSRQLAAFFTPHGYGATYAAEFPAMADYWIANRVFVLCLDCSDPAQKSQALVFMNASNYPPGVPVFGVFYSEGTDVQTLENWGYPTDICGTPNFSVTSSFPSDVAKLTGPSVNLPALDTNGVYVGFYVTDGDSISFTAQQHYYLWTRSPSRGKYPIGWSANVQLLDLFPTLFQSLSRNNYTNKYELIADTWHVGWANSNGFAPFINRYKYYHDNANGLFQTVNLTKWFSSSTTSQMQDITTEAGFSEWLDGYSGGRGNVVAWSTFGAGNLVHAGMSGPTQGGASANSVAQAIRANVNAGQTGTPVFVTVCAGDGTVTTDCVGYVDQAVSNVLASPAPGRNYYWMRPSDVGAMWRKWKGVP